MSETTALWYAIMVIALSWIMIGVLLKIVSSFGFFSEVTRDTYADNKRLRQENLLLEVDNMALADKLAACEQRRIQPFHQPLQSEDVA
jgi:hypothetical protein